MRKLRSTSASKQAQAAYEISCIMRGSPSPTSAGVECFVAAGAIPVLVHLLESSSAVEVQKQVAVALMILGFWDTYAIMIAEAGGIHALAKLVRCGPATVQGAAVAALAFVVAYSEGHTRANLAAAAEAVPFSIQMLRSDP